VTTSGKKKRRVTRQNLYSRGDANRAVDALVHPLIKQNKIFLVVDELAHIAIEGNVEESIVKFTRYRLPELVRELLRIWLGSD